jgi:hypothetical protein
MPIDHLVYAAENLDAAVEHLEGHLGVRATPGGSHPGIGTRNALLALGAGTYLEVIAPDPSQPPPTMPRPFGIDDGPPDHLAGWAISCADIDAAIASSRARGYDPGEAVDMQRSDPSAGLIQWRLTLNALAGGPVPFLIAWGTTVHPAGTAPAGLVLDELRIEHPDPPALNATLRALGAEVAVTAAQRFALVARISGPLGSKELR